MRKLILFLSAFLFLNGVNAQSIQLLTPNGGESLTGCTDAIISWTKQGNLSPYINLYYSVDEGLNWRSIKSNYYSPNTSDNVIWSVPTVNSSQVKIKIQDTYYTSVKDSSDLHFTISSDLSTTGLTVISPNGGESFSPTTIQTISWTSKGMIGNVNIGYSVDGGKTWTPLSSQTTTAINIPNTGTFNWLIPADANLVSSRVLIRVSETNKPCNIDFSDAFFTINNTPGIVIQSPVNNETWYVGRYHTLSWRSFNIPGDKVKIDYSIDNGSSWIVLDDSISSNSGFGLSWIVPNTVTNQGLMRVSASRNNTIQSVVNFKIAEPYLLLNRPNGGEVLSGCNKAYISWTQLGIVDTVYVDYSLDGGNKWNLNAINKYSNKNGPDSVAFSIPNVKTNAARFRIHENTNQLLTLRDSSDANVTIAADASRAITLVYPNGGESIPVNSLQKVKWTSKGSVGNISIQYSNDGGKTWRWMYGPDGDSSRYIPNTGVFNWQLLPYLNILSPTDRINIRIYESANPCIIDWTDSTFGLHNDPHISIVKPGDGDSLFVGRTATLLWLSSQFTNVDIDYSLDNGVTWKVIFDSIYTSDYSTNLRPWIIPNTLTDTGILRIRSATTPSIENKITFKIVNPILRLITPSGGESFTNCTDTQINWYQKGTSPDITIEYSLNEGVNWLVIDTKTNVKDGVDNYIWRVPNIGTSKLRVRVSDANNNQIKDGSKANVNIIPDTTIGVRLISPNGGEVLQPGTVQTVKWVSKGLLQNITLEYSTDLGKTWNLMYDTQGKSSYYLTDNGSFDWLLVGNVVFSDKCLVRISHFGRTCTLDYSDNYFSINNNPVITILDPTPNDTLYTGVSCYDIKWSHYNIPGDQVSLDYSLDNGVHWNVIVDSTYSKPVGNSFRWTVPNVVSKQSKLRIASARNKSIKSEVSFRIDTTFVKLLYPAGGEVFENCIDSKIVWQNHGEPGNVNIDYSLDEGKNWIHFIGVARKDGIDSITWQTPNVNSDKVRVRMIGECNPSIGDSSKVNFTINKNPSLGLQITYPNGGESFTVNTYHTVTWTTKGNIDRVTLLYTDDNGRTWSYMTNPKTGLTSFNIPNTGSYSWQVPWWLYDFSKLKIQISANSNRCLDDYTDSLINIDRNPSVAIVKPEQSETLYPGQAYDIKWTTYAFPDNAVGYVHIEYSLDNGSNWTSLEDSTYAAPHPNVNTFKWTVPNASTNQGILRIHSSRNKAYKDEVNFKIIAPYVNLLNPIGNETWYKGESQTIAWNVGGLATNSLLNIEYSIDDAQTWNFITAVNSAQSNYTWTIPDTVSSKCYIKISSTTIALCKDSNKVAFSIQKPFHLTSPHAGETWHIGEPQLIQWNSSGISGNVKIEYSDTRAWDVVIENTPNTGSYLWKLPTTIKPSTHYFLKITDVATPTAYNISAPFEIAGPVITAVPLLETDESWTVYPNPTQDILKISSNAVTSGSVHVRLINAQGQLVLDQHDRAINGVYTKVINLNEEKPGIYILQIITDKQVINRRVTKN